MCIFLHKFKIAETVHFSDSVFFVSFYQFLKAAYLETAALLEGCDLWLFWSLRCAGDCAQLETAHHFDILWYMLRTSLNPNFVEVLIEIHIYCCLVFFSLWKRYRLTAWCFFKFLHWSGYWNRYSFTEGPYVTASCCYIPPCWQVGMSSGCCLRLRRLKRTVHNIMCAEDQHWRRLYGRYCVEYWSSISEDALILQCCVERLRAQP